MHLRVKRKYVGIPSGDPKFFTGATLETALDLWAPSCQLRKVVCVEFEKEETLYSEKLFSSVLFFYR